MVDDCDYIFRCRNCGQPCHGDMESEDSLICIDCYDDDKVSNSDQNYKDDFKQRTSEAKFYTRRD